MKWVPQNETFLQAPLRRLRRLDRWHSKLLRGSEISPSRASRKRTIDEIAEQVLRRPRMSSSSWTMGITHHVHGVENVQAIANLAMVRGMVGRPTPVSPDPWSLERARHRIGWCHATLKDAIFHNLQQHFGCQLPSTPGLDTLSCIESSAAGHMRVGVCLGGNLYGANPDAEYAEQALTQLKLVAYLSTTLNTGHVRGLARRTLILPVLARDEEPQPTTQESMFNYVRLSDGGPAAA